MSAGAFAVVLLLVQEVLAGVVYAPPAKAAEARVRADVQAIRQAGYNMIVPADAAAARRVTRLAAEAGLAVGSPMPAAYRRIDVARGARATAEARVAFWNALADGAHALAFAGTGNAVTPEVVALGETAGIVTRNLALFGPLQPRREGVRSVSAAGGGHVEVKLLESADALVIIALSRSASPQKATIRFAADVPEAIWQNLETGTSVNFVMEQDGPVVEHTFAPRDSLVLMIRKKLRK